MTDPTALPVPGDRADLGHVDRLVHEPARMAILTVLQRVDSADFQFLQSVLGLTKGNLSSHLTRLEAAGLVQISKGYVGKKPHTDVALTAAGHQAIDRHWAQLDRLRSLAD